MLRAITGRRFWGPLLALSLAALAPARALAFSLAGGGPGAFGPPPYSLAPRGAALDLQGQSPLPLLGRGRLAQAAPPPDALPAPVGEINGALLDPLEIPKPSFGQYALDTSIATFVVFAWKRALNVSAARRIIVENYDNFSHTISRSPPINDTNNWTTNWIAHPILGAYFYLFFRSRGHTRLAASVETFILSTLHEYAIETSFEPASGIDLIITPALGVPLGLLLDELSIRWVRSESKTVRFFGYVLNPLLTMPWARWRRDIRYDPNRDSFAVQIEWRY